MNRFIVASALIHVGLMFLLGLVPTRSPPTSTSRPLIVQLEPLPEKPKSLDQARTRNRIVQSKAGEVAPQAEDNAYLGEKTRVVDRQTVSNARTTLASSGKELSQTKPEPQETTENETRKAEDMRNRELGLVPTQLGRFGVPLVPGNKIQKDLKDMQRADILARPYVPPTDVEWKGFAQAPSEYIQGMAESDQTALNTKEYVFYGYFQRIRERLDRAWIPILRQRIAKLYRTGRRLASEMDHTTRVVVVLNKLGEVTRVQIISESGYTDLDDAAVKAFNEAGPFPNPPRGITDSREEVKIPWEFILKT